jgi:predicted ATP-grasp superfamily ATP-dependent carboligase
MKLPGPDAGIFLCATSDRFALLVARHQQLLARRFCFVSPSAAVLEAIIDKARLYEIARQNDIPHPAFHVVADRSDIDAAVAIVRTPCYVKPALGYRWRQFGHRKLERAETENDLRRCLEGFLAEGLVAIPQEIIPGSDGDVYSVFAYIDRSGQCVGWRTKRKLRQWPLDAGNGSCQEICEQPKVAELGLRLLAITGHLGPATVEFRRDRRNGRFVLMEINARTSACQELITRSGLDAPLIAYHDARGKSQPAQGPVVPMRWVHFGSDFRAFRALRRTGRITTWHWLKSVARCRCFAYFAFDDPVPVLAKARAWLTSRLTGSVG